ncbi:MAG: ABC transporter substrate-binding protein [Lachnospiraceae bacterium]|nr:ABC transporter substrate-binding protein [Lachnospiraceae bacterium]
MKKFIAIFMAAMMLFGLTACGSSTDTASAGAATQEAAETTEAAASTEISSTEATEGSAEKPESITITSLNGDRAETQLEVPYDPQRIAVLDMPSLDILDSLGLGDRIVGSASVTIEYLTDYNPDDSNGAIMNLGTVKTADLEKVAACEPDIIFIGGRLSSVYNDLSAIAPVVYLAVDYEKGVVESTADNAKTLASIFGLENEIDAKMEGFQARIDALKAVLEGKDVLLSMYNSNALGLMDTESQLNIIAKELGANNLGETVGETEKATHGEEASWETIITLNPEYMFVLDRSTATGAAGEDVLGAKEVIENDLIKELDVYKDGKIIYFIDHANVWYTSTGGIQALDTMLADLEGALLP